jgi:polysaccharide biosynthesis protein PslG
MRRATATMFAALALSVSAYAFNPIAGPSEPEPVVSATPVLAAVPTGPMQSGQGLASTGKTAPAKQAGKKQAGKKKSPQWPRKTVVGVNFHGTHSQDYDSDADRKQVLDKLVKMGAKWVRIDISWAGMQPERGPIDPNSADVKYLDGIIKMARARDLKVLGMFWLTPEWANPPAGERSLPSNPNDYARALAWAANHWKGQVRAWEVWNEPNLPDWMYGTDPVEYTRVLCAAAKAVRTHPGNPNVKVVYGAPSANDTAWIQRTYAAGAKGCFDILATHPYQGPADQGPAGGDGSEVWHFNHLRQVRALMGHYNDNSNVWLTEFGWSSHPNYGWESNGERGVTEQAQATFTVNSLKMLRSQFPFVKKAFIYVDRADPEESEHLQGFGILDENSNPKPIYSALRAYLR